jgi:hypothetical protein
MCIAGCIDGRSGCDQNRDAAGQADLQVMGTTCRSCTCIAGSQTSAVYEFESVKPEHQIAVLTQSFVGAEEFMRTASRVSPYDSASGIVPIDPLLRTCSFLS